MQRLREQFLSRFLLATGRRVTEEYEYFRVHHQVHEDILEKLIALRGESLVLDKQDKIDEDYRQFYKKLQTYLKSMTVLLTILLSNPSKPSS